MDKETRNLIFNTTQAIRRLLEEEFALQLEGTFDVHPDGRVSDQPGAQLTPVERLVQRRIIEALHHRRAIGESSVESVRGFQSEAVFTFLNRLAALKMMEARDLVLPCVSRGDESQGFKEFSGLAPGLIELPDKGYRLYLECLFDEIGREVGVLFDRTDAASQLWPRRKALEAVLDKLDNPELAGVWVEDETIGWIYQYYNDPEERKQMREDSSAPRNSRELAVRNQFFTPRYVVAFLTDNTLGRIWYEMAWSKTKLKEQCRYLVCRPNEIFLKPDETAPEQAKQDNVSQEDLLTLPVHISHRPLKDPRTILMLDPACGSMHFGLYAFELFEVIYAEAWDVEGELGDEALNRQPGLNSLHQTYPHKDAFLRDVPRLIIEHNIHGIDIDPRAAQIAGLALWLRAQKAWQKLGIKPGERPAIRRSNIVCAEPMPGEKNLLREFVDRHFASVERPLFHRILESVWGKMQLAGEAGSLLKIEEEIRSLVANAKLDWKEGPLLEQTSLFPESEVLPRQKEMRLDLSGITDAQFFDRVEDRIYDALETYADQAENGGEFQRRLFADDAAQGFAFIDLCRKRYDVAVMNPPFGKCSQGSAAYYETAYTDFKSDIGIAFVDRFTRLAAASGCVGAITSRAFLASDSLDEWRKERLLESTPLHSMLDLGYGVLDDAMVEAAAYVIDACSTLQTPRAFIRALECREKEDAVASFFQSHEVKNDLLFFLHDLADFKSVPLAVICYWLPASLLHKLQKLPALPDSGGAARHGLVTTDDWRFLRLTWEIAPNAMRDGAASRCWKLLAKGGEYQPFWDDIHICVDWSGDGNSLKTFLADKRLKTQGSADWTPWLNHSEFYRLEGLTYPERTTSDFCPRILPRDVIFSSTGQAIQFNKSREAAFAYLCGSFTRFFKLVVESFVGSGDNAFPGSAAKHYRSGLLNQLPAPLTDGTGRTESIALAGVSFAKRLFAKDETARNFCPSIRRGSLLDMCLSSQASFLDSSVTLISLNCEIESLIAKRFDLGQAELDVLDEIIGPHPTAYTNSQPVDPAAITALWRKQVSDIVEFCIQRDGPRRQLTKKSFIADRKLELVCHGLKLPPSSVASVIKSSACVDDDTVREVGASELSFALGCVLGRWDIRYATGERQAPELPDPFAPLPACPPGMLQGNDALPLSPEAGLNLRAEGSYPLDVAWDGILVDDPNHPLDIIECVREVLRVIWKDCAESIEHEVCEILGVKTLRDYFRKPTAYFADHLSRYSKSRRQAPIYWPLSSPNGLYTVWLYYHRLTPDTLFTVQRDHLKPKLEYEERRAFQLRQDAGTTPSPSQRQDIAEAEELVEDLRAFKAELDRVPPLFRPNLNDGVIVNYAPLWRLIGLPKWRKECQSVWNELLNGEYDWAHLALHLWPERVIPKCSNDRSLAIAHDLDEVFWQEDPKCPGKWLPTKVPAAKLEQLIAGGTSPAVKAALESLAGASPTTNPKRARKGKP